MTPADRWNDGTVTFGSRSRRRSTGVRRTRFQPVRRCRGPAPSRIIAGGVDPANIVTVTQLPDRRCGWCHRPLEERPGSGRPRRFCSPSHRQRAYEARRHADSLQVPTGQAIVTEADLRLLHDRLYRLESAVEDVQSDLTGTPSARAYPTPLPTFWMRRRTWWAWLSSQSAADRRLAGGGRRQPVRNRR